MRKSSRKYRKLLERAPWIKYYGDIPPILDYPNFSIVEMLEKTAKKFPNLIAYEYFGRECKFSRFIEKIEETACALKEQGIKENDVITICAPNTPQAIIMFYAVNMVGAIASMVHPLSGEKEIEYYLNESHTKLVLVIDIAYEKVLNVLKNTHVEKIILMSASNEMGPIKTFLYWFFKGRKTKIEKSEDTYTWKEFIDIGYCYKKKYRAKRKGSDPAVILYSGGTTGSPKGIVLSNKNFNAEAVQSALMCDPNGPGDSILSIMPIFHSFGLGVCTHTTLCIGMKSILIPAFSAKDFGNLIKKHKPNFIVGVPTLFEALLKTKGLKERDLECASCVISGGDILNPDLKKKIDDFLSKHGSHAKIKVGYGLTEGCGASCLTPTGYYKPESIGIPFPDTIYKIVKMGTNEEVLTNEVGEICISGPTVMMGYLNEPKETMKVLRVHDDRKLWLHTGDVGCIDSEGFVFYKQRLKRIIISSGYNIYPSYVEEVINSHPAVLASTVIGIKHPYKKQVAKALIILKEGIIPTLEIKKSILKHCEKNLAKYSVPYEIEYRKTFPKTLVGKVAYGEIQKEENKNHEFN